MPFRQKEIGSTSESRMDTSSGIIRFVLSVALGSLYVTVLLITT